MQALTWSVRTNGAPPFQLHCPWMDFYRTGRARSDNHIVHSRRAFMGLVRTGPSGPHYSHPRLLDVLRSGLGFNLPKRCQLH